MKCVYITNVRRKTVLIWMEVILWAIRFFFGACMFSFLNVIIDRMPRGESVVKGRSHCTGCGRVLTPPELIPCISYLCLGGKCRSCRKPIPVRDFMVELFGGLAFIGCGICFGCGSLGILSMSGTVIFAYLGILMVIALIDWDTQIIYDRFHICILLLGIACIWLFPQHSVTDRLAASLIISVPMLILTLIIPGAFGGGDIKLMAVSGFLLGIPSVICAMFFGLVTGGGYAAIMLKTGKLGRKDHFAFGPFLAFGLALSAFAGDRIMAWYLSFL